MMEQPKINVHGNFVNYFKRFRIYCQPKIERHN